MSWTYQQLLSLVSGTGSVVERLDAAVMKAITVETPVMRALRALVSSGEPKHVVLSGNAGDGKSFLLKSLQPLLRAGEWELFMDASEEDVDALAARLSSALADGRRIFLAINRGKLERLREWISSAPAEDPILPFRDSIERGLLLRVAWTDQDASALGDVAVIDLGVFDSLERGVVEAVLTRASEATPPPVGAARAAFESAQVALGDLGVRGRLLEALEAVRSSGHHVTMRQLWQGAALMLTGGLPEDSPRGLALADTLAGRIFSDQRGAPLLEWVRRLNDPSAVPQPALMRAALVGDLDGHLRALPGLAAVELDGRCDPLVVRAAWLHGSELVTGRPHLPAEFDALARSLLDEPEGWHPDGALTEQVLAGVYGALGLWRAGSVFPAWQKLCYDSRMIDGATALAEGEVDLDRLRVAVPRPNPRALAALGPAYRPPYVLFGVPSDSVGGALALTPSMLERLLARSAAGGRERSAPLLAAEQEILRRWLSRLPRKGEDRFRVRRDGGSVLSVQVARGGGVRLDLGS